MCTYFGRDDDRGDWLRRTLTPGTRVLFVTGVIVTTIWATDSLTSPSALAAPAGSTGSAVGATGLAPGGGVLESAHTSGATQTTAPSTPGNFRLERRTGSQLRLNWDWVSGGVGAIHYDFSYAGRTVVLNQYYPGHTLDVGDLDLSPGQTYTFVLRAIDAAGNASAPAQLLFETTPPASPSNLQQISTRRITYNDGHHEDYPDLISFAPARDDAGPLRYYEAVVDGRSFGVSAGGQATQFSLFGVISESYTSIPCGPTTVQLRAYDASLNASQLSAPLTVFFPEYENCPPPHQDTR